MSEPMLHTKIWCLVSELMLYSKYVMFEYMLHTNIRLFSVRTNVTYENLLCPNICYTRIWGVLFPNLCYIPKYNMSEPMLYTKIWCLVSELILHTNMCNVWTNVTHKTMMYCVRTHFTYKCVMSEHILHTNMKLYSVRINVHSKMCNVRTYATHEYEIIFCPN